MQTMAENGHDDAEELVQGEHEAPFLKIKDETYLGEKFEKMKARVVVFPFSVYLFLCLTTPPHVETLAAGWGAA